MNLGAGRIVLQDLPRIDAAIADGSLVVDPETGIVSRCLAKKRWHSTSRRSDFAGWCTLSPRPDRRGRKDVGRGRRACLYTCVAGRPRYAAVFCRAISRGICRSVRQRKNRDDLRSIFRNGPGQTLGPCVAGYKLLVDAHGERAADAVAAVKASYEAGTTDEFVEPTAIDDYSGMQDSDGILMLNFRADRAREILTALLDPAFNGFDRGRVVNFATTLGMIRYPTLLTRSSHRFSRRSNWRMCSAIFSHNPDANSCGLPRRRIRARHLF